MKKVVVVLLMFIVTMFSFAKGSYVPHIDKNNDEIVFSARTEIGDKVLTIYREEEHLIYTFGKDGEAEVEILGLPQRNLFKNSGDWSGSAVGKFLVFKDKNYTYVISYFDMDKPVYKLKVYKDKDHKPIYSTELENTSVTNKIIANNMYYDNLSKDPEYDEYYLNW